MKDWSFLYQLCAYLVYLKVGENKFLLSNGELWEGIHTENLHALLSRVTVLTPK